MIIIKYNPSFESGTIHNTFVNGSYTFNLYLMCNFNSDFSFLLVSFFLSCSGSDCFKNLVPVTVSCFPVLKTNKKASFLCSKCLWLKIGMCLLSSPRVCFLLWQHVNISAVKTSNKNIDLNFIKHTV